MTGKDRIFGDQPDPDLAGLNLQYKALDLPKLGNLEDETESFLAEYFDRETRHDINTDHPEFIAVTFDPKMLSEYKLLGKGEIDKTTRAFVDSLFRRKVALEQQLTQMIMRGTGSGAADRDNFMYLNHVLSIHILGANPYALGDAMDESENLRGGSSRLVSNRQIMESYHDESARKTAAIWISRRNPQSTPAKEVQTLGVVSSSGSHYRLLQEMWPRLSRRFGI